MITTKLIGRLGNQIFQIAATIAYAKKHDMPYWVPQFSLAPHIWPTYFFHFPKTPSYPYDYVKYTEPGFEYTEIPFHKHIGLEGYFQSEKYFVDYRKEVMEAFQFPWQMLEGFVSIHVRRGDYLQMPEKHPFVGADYLNDAVNFFYTRGYKSFLVSSDDIAWCKQFFTSDLAEEQQLQFTYSDVTDPIEAMVLMSCCEHNIIANSSFSWWSAWLNQNPDKIVIAPELWFGPGNSHLNTKDLIPESWMKM